MFKLRFNLKCLFLGIVLALFLWIFSLDKVSINVFKAVTRKPEGNDSIKTEYNVWLTFTRTSKHSVLINKFENLISNLLNISLILPRIHIIADDDSKKVADEIIREKSRNVNRTLYYNFYNITEVAASIDDIVKAMLPYFSSRRDSYYGDTLFYISLGLYRFAPLNQSVAVMLDCDLYFKKDIALLFQEFNSFNASNLFGLAPELSPVYRHILTKYRSKHKTTFGDFYHNSTIMTGVHPRGFQGYNSGIILLNLTAIRNSKEYPHFLSETFIKDLVKKYYFKGHLGDQDFYTLLGYERPDLFKTLNCGYNRQLCTWWRDHGYGDIFAEYFKCNHEIVVLHGNCHTKLPKS